MNLGIELFPHYSMNRNPPPSTKERERDIRRRKYRKRAGRGATHWFISL
jgi:hypothetical protein